MANENETVANVHDDMLQVVADEFGNVTMAQSDFVEYAVRFVAAHTRDLADFQRRYDECVRRFNEADLERVRLRDEVAAKDSEIANLKWKVENYAQVVAAKDAEIAKLGEEVYRRDRYCEEADSERMDVEVNLRALVKELSDALSQSVINHCYRCKFFRLKHTECKDKKNEIKCWSKSFKLLIEKSREVCK